MRARVFGGMAAGLLAVTTLALIPSSPASGAEGGFSCRASVIRLGPLEPLIANAAGAPCADESSGVIDNQMVGDPTMGAEISVLSVRTNSGADDDPATQSADAASDVVHVKLFGPPGSIEADILTSKAHAECAGSTPTFTSESHVAKLVVNGSEIFDVKDHQDVPIIDPAIGTIHLNETINDTDGTDGHVGVTQQALAVDLQSDGTSEVVVAESMADADTDACAPAKAGFMIGDGIVAEPGSAFDTNGQGDIRSDETYEHHVFDLKCLDRPDPGPGHESLDVHVVSETKSFAADIHMRSLGTSTCSTTGPDPEPPFGFDTIEGRGRGVCNFQGLTRAAVSFTHLRAPQTLMNLGWGRGG